MYDKREVVEKGPRADFGAHVVELEGLRAQVNHSNNSSNDNNNHSNDNSSNNNNRSNSNTIDSNVSSDVYCNTSNSNLSSNVSEFPARPGRPARGAPGYG